MENGENHICVKHIYNIVYLVVAIGGKSIVTCKDVYVSYEIKIGG